MKEREKSGGRERERGRKGKRERERETRSVGADESNTEATEATSCGELGNKSPSLLKVTNKPPSVTLRRHPKTFQAAVAGTGRKGEGKGGGSSWEMGDQRRHHPARLPAGLSRRHQSYRMTRQPLWLLLWALIPGVWQ